MEILWLVVMLSAFDLFAGGLFYIFDSEADPNYLSEVKRYQSGELWWWEVRNNEKEFSKNVQHCRDSANKAESSFYSALCKMQAIKLVVNYYVKSCLKQFLWFVQKNSDLILCFIIICTFGLSLAYIIDRRIYYLGKLNRSFALESPSAIESVHSNQPSEDPPPSVEKMAEKEEEASVAPVNTEEPSHQLARKEEESTSQMKVKLMRKSASGSRSDVFRGREIGQARKIAGHH